LGAQAVLLDSNRGTLVELARRCRESGLDYLAIKPYSQHPASLTREHSGTDYTELDGLAKALAGEETDGFKVIFRSAAFGAAVSGKRGYGKCLSTPVFWAYVRANGDVYGCLDFLNDPAFRYGNIHESSFEAVWEGEARRKGLEHMTNRHDLSRCRVNCRMGQVNEYLWELRHPSEHANFI
jgi:radical SAM protein with 4Fe4S-binding SPASM domain